MVSLSWFHGIKVSFVPHYCLPHGAVVFDTDANHLRGEQLRNNGLILYQLQCGLGGGSPKRHSRQCNVFPYYSKSSPDAYVNIISAMVNES